MCGFEMNLQSETKIFEHDLKFVISSFCGISNFTNFYFSRQHNLTNSLLDTDFVRWLLI